jgi:MFS family permease
MESYGSLSRLFISSITFFIRRKYLAKRVETRALSCPPTDLHVSRYWGGLQHHKPHYPPLLRGIVNAASNIGNIFGQLIFGFLGDALGRKFIYGKEPIVFIIGTILVISMSNSIPTSTLKMIWIFRFWALMGVGIGCISGRKSS